MFDWIRDALVGMYEWFIPCTVIDQYQEGVVLRLGVYNRTLLPGFHWIIPFHVEDVLFDQVVTRVIDLKSQSLTTSDGVPVVVSGAVTLSISNIKKALLSVRSVHQAVADSCCGVIGQQVRRTPWNELASDAFTELLTSACKERAKKYGLAIEMVQLTDLARMRALRLHVDQINDYRGRDEEG